MYERNAIVLERYFNQIFGYDMKYNIKTNFNDYCELVECLEKYKDISEKEEVIMEEYDSIANKIREIQKVQESLNKKNNKLQEERNSVLQNIGENADVIRKKIDNVNNNIDNINEEIKENVHEFVNIIKEFNEKSDIRTDCERTRRIIENDYNKKLNKTLENYKEIDIAFQKNAKQFVEQETENIEKELKDKINKNGQKEKIPFNSNVVKEAISLSIDVQKRETTILANNYDKTSKLFNEIKNNTTKIEKHKKNIKDSKSKLEFIAAIKDYLIQFLDNERLTVVNGEDEHNNLMKEACKNFYEDLEQINNLYTLLLKEITKKVTKKSYSELYNVDYLKALEKKAQEFDKEIKKLNLPVTVINPNYWRIEGMKRIYNVFYKCVTENYGRDLSEYFILEDEYDEEDSDEESDELIENNGNVQNEEKKVEVKNKKSRTKGDDIKTDIDKKIDMILGINKDYNVWNKDEEDNEDDWEDEDWENDSDLKEDEEWEDELAEDDSNDWNEDDDNETDDEDEEDEEDEYGWEETEDDNETDEDDDEDWNSINIKKDKPEEDKDNWSNEFIKMDKPKKKRSIFNKLKKQMDKN